MKRLSWKSVVVLSAALLVLAFSAGVVFWTRSTMGPSAAALSALQSDEQVRVNQVSSWIAFEPASNQPASGFIFYPGAGVDFRSYAPIMRQLATENYLVVLLRSPLNLAFFNAGAAGQVMEEFPQIAAWVVGGHSLGGVVAAGYVARHPSVSGLVLWASYPGDDSLRHTQAKVLSVYGSRDGLTRPAQIQDSRSLLPANSTFVKIPGGNHSQFGSYGLQAGDREATISPEEQWSQIAAATASLLASLSR